ncbi:heterokaryon incompatibility protein-domain-containing protein [Leptodontidium sp. MPI-SDFR-AT-0119]|nr:heterokaryon incompatibility protein-domain-containing protein [Leptodontidium sp. MPI-SDFR-AT-0119]
MEETTPLYEYSPLPTEPAIRLLDLSPGVENSPLRGSLKTFPLAEVPSYLALSYVWGSDEKPHAIQIGSFHVKITTSLNHALRDNRAMASVNNKNIFIWADGICINQSDTAELNSQVALMGSIYRSAVSVVTYIGPADQRAYSGLQLGAKLVEFAQSRGQGSYRDLELIQDSNFQRNRFPPAWHSSWAALSELMDRAWSSRVWIVQESLLNRQVAMVLGRVIVHRDLFGKLAHLSLNGRIPRVTTERRGSDCLTAQDDLKSYAYGHGYDYPHPKTFYHLLRMCHILNSKNAKDKVYALLGVAHDRDQMGIVPDYTKTEAEVYTDVAMRLIQTDSNLDLFSSVWSKKTIQLPTWVPDWSTMPDDPMETLISNPILMKKKLHQAAGDTTADFVFSEDLKRLHLTGCVVDRISIVDRTEREGRLLSPFFFQHLDHLAGLPLYSNNLDDIENWRVLLQYFFTTTASSLASVPSSDLSFFEAGLRLDAALDGYTMPDMTLGAAEMKKIQVLVAAFIHTVANRRFFITEMGYMGLGPKEIVVGDLAVVLLGGKFPYILRESDGIFKLLGKSYVHGIMRGEALRPESSDGVELRTFTLI